MFPKPRKLETESELYDAALRALMRRAHSIHELKKNLARRAADPAHTQNVLDRLKREGLLDDARYAAQFVRYRAESRRQGKFRIARDLRARGVPGRHIESAFAAGPDAAAEAAVVRTRIQRKLKAFRGEIEPRRIAAIYASLLRAGFPADIIRRELRALTRKDVPEVDSSPPEDL